MAYPDERNLTTKERVIRWCEINDPDVTMEADIVDTINRVSSFLSLKISKSGVWLARNLTERYDGNGKDVLPLRSTPVNSVASVKIYGEAIPASNGYSTYGYFVDNGFLRLIGYYFSLGTSSVEVTYNAGIDDSSPYFDVLEQACLEALNFKWRRKAHPDQVAGKVGQGFINEQFTQNDFPAEVWSAVNLLSARLTQLYVG